MKIKTFEMPEKRFGELLEHIITVGFVGAVTGQSEKKLEFTSGWLESVFINVKEAIQFQEMKESITKASVKTKASMLEKDSWFIEAYVGIINDMFVISGLFVGFLSVLKELNCFVQSSLLLLQNRLDYPEPQSASL